jgi:O-antigen/teichoic acid export membrane protein
VSEARSGDIAQLARGGRTNLFGFFLRLAARIPFLFIAGRAAAYGPAALGRFASALVVIELTAMVCTMGEKRGLAQRLALAEGVGETRPANVVSDGALLAVIASATMALLFWIFPEPLFPGAFYTSADRLMVLAIPPLALTEIWLAALAYGFNVGASVSARSIVEPWTLSIVAGLMVFVAPASGLAIAYLASIYAAAFAAWLPYRRAYGSTLAWCPRLADIARLTVHSIPLALADAIEWGTRRLDILILGMFAAPRAVGVYYVAQQVASLPQKLKTSFEPVLGPVITRKLKERDYPAIARQLCQVGFWIIAAQLGIALAGAIPGKGVMGVFGPQFVGGTGALAFLLAAEVAGSTAVVAEAALIYVAPMRNLALSIATIGLQALLTLGGILLVRRTGYNELHAAASVAGALMLALGFGSLVKARLLESILQARVRNWRWPLLLAAIPTALVGWAAGRFLPEWAELTFGEAAMFGVYGAMIWRCGFGPEDRLLFRKAPLA